MGARSLVVALAALAVVAVPSAGWAAAEATVGPLVSGTVSYVDGTFAWTDYVYDDTGPDTDGEAGGDAAYDQEPGNLADLVQVQVGQQQDRWRLTALLETLLDPAVPSVGFGFDLDSDPTTGAASLPGGSWLVSGRLGLERAVIVSSEGALVLEHRDGGWHEARRLASDIDPTTNSIRTEVPVTAVPAGGSRVNVVAVAGLAGARSWATGDGPIFDLAFVGDEPHVGWQDRHQSRVLAGDRPAREAVASIDLAGLRSRRTATASASEPGFHTLLYRSALDLPEGIRDFTITAPGGRQVPISNFYAGPYQPYVVRIPQADLGDDPPMLVYLHGITTTHTGILDQFRDGAGFDPPAVTVFPLGRGETTFYIGAAEQDVLDVVADAVDRYGVDEDRIALAGRSMGGFGTFRFGVRYPDRWSSMTAFIGTGASAQSELGVLPPEVLDALFSPTRFPAGNAELIENVRNVPVRIVDGQLDPIVNTALPEHDALRLDQLGYEYRYWSLTRREHEVVPALSDCLLVEAAAARRVASPAHVTYSVEPAIFMTDPTTGLDLQYRGAWWVSGIRARGDVDDAGEQATVDAISLARPDRRPATRPVLEAGQNLTEGRDLCGENPDVRTGDAWRLRGIDHVGSPPQPVSNRLRVTLSRVAAVTLDLPDAGIDTTARVTAEARGDGPTAIHFATGRSTPVHVTVDGTTVGTVTPHDGVVTVTADLAGDHTIVLEPTTDTPPAASSPAGRSLPVTGGGTTWPALLALAVLTTARTPRTSETA